MKRSIAVICAAGSALFAFSAASQDETAPDAPGTPRTGGFARDEGRPDPVSIMRNGILEQIDFRELRERYPAASGGGIDPDALAADGVVGWYDSGHHFHPERMNARAPGSEKLDPENRKGKGLRGKDAERKGKEPGAEIDRKGKDPIEGGVGRKGKDPVEGGLGRKGKDPIERGVERKGKDPSVELERKGKDPIEGIERKGKEPGAEIDQKGKEPIEGGVERKGADPAVEGVERKGADPAVEAVPERAVKPGATPRVTPAPGAGEIERVQPSQVER